jgi:alpha-beta hydrolase superfamily lysophospholipase
MQTHAILIHGMGRTPLAMLPLANRLRVAGLRPVLFGYSATFESWDHCLDRLGHFVDKHVGDDRFIMVGHSLGTVLTRAVLARLGHPPLACFFLAPPTQACLAARTFSRYRLYRLLTGEMGQLLASAPFMDALPLPDVPTRIYAGTGGPTGPHAPFGEEANDGLLTVAETTLPAIALRTVPSLHTFIMNAKIVAQDIIDVINGMHAQSILADSAARNTTA